MTKMTQHARCRSAAGFTVLEVLVATLMLGIGLVGIMGMQATSAVANRSTYNTRVATELAESIYERVKRDALEWTASSTPPSESWLMRAYNSRLTVAAELPSTPEEEIGSWTRDSGTFSKLPMMNDLGIQFLNDGTNTSTSVQQTRGQRFCVEYRMNDIVPDEMVQLSVRVLWARTQAGEDRLGGNCEILTDATIAGVRNRLFDSVTVTGTFRRNVLNANATLPPAT